MLSSLNQFVGHRLRLPNDTNDIAEIIAWHHPRFTPAHHLALRVRQGDTVVYLSLSPHEHPNFSGSKLFDLRHGYDAYFMNTYEDELLVQGMRAAWPDIRDAFSADEQARFTEDAFKKLTDRELLSMALTLSAEKQQEVRIKGSPTQIVPLRSLNVTAMIQDIHALKAPAAKTKWALWSGTEFHEAHTYNCASIVLRVLSAGGLHELTPPNRDLAGYAGGLLGAIYAYANHQQWQTAMKNILTAVLVARGLQGAYEGYTGIQRYLNFNAGKSKDPVSAVIGLRLLSVVLSSLQGAISSEPFVPKIIAMPGDTLALVQEAKHEEDSRFKPLQAQGEHALQYH